MWNEFDDAGTHIHLITRDASLGTVAPPLQQQWSTSLTALAAASSHNAPSTVLILPVWPTVFVALFLLYLLVLKSTNPTSVYVRNTLQRIAKASTHMIRVATIAFVAAHHDTYYLPAGRKYDVEEPGDQREYLLSSLVDATARVTAKMIDTGPPWLASGHHRIPDTSLLTTHQRPTRCLDIYHSAYLSATPPRVASHSTPPYRPPQPLAILRLGRPRSLCIVPPSTV
jgi:hypothetical protein